MNSGVWMFSLQSIGTYMMAAGSMAAGDHLVTLICLPVAAVLSFVAMFLWKDADRQKPS